MENEKEPILVLGGGHQGISMAAHLALNGEKVHLWNRSYEHIKEIAQTKAIHCSGIVEGIAHIDRVTTNLDEVMTKRIMITTPASAHHDLAVLLAGRVTGDHVVILNPGRTFGAIEFAHTMRQAGCAELPHIAETQTIVYTCRRDETNGAVIYALKHDVRIASLKKEDISLIVSVIPECLCSYFVPAQSVIETSLENVGMVLHCAPVLMNIGWIESPSVDFKYYYDGISPSIAAFITKVDEERLAVAAAFGYRLPSTAEWMHCTYDTKGDSLYEHIRANQYYKEIDAPKTLCHRYLEEDVPCGLVPLESAAKHVGVATPYVSLIIDLANAILGRDFRKTGRRYIETEV